MSKKTFSNSRPNSLFGLNGTFGNDAELLLGRPLPDVVHVDQRFQVEDLQLPLGSILLEILLVPGLPGDGVAVPVSVARQLVMVVMLLAARRQQLERGQRQAPAFRQEDSPLRLKLLVSLVLI